MLLSFGYEMALEGSYVEGLVPSVMSKGGGLRKRLAQEGSDILMIVGGRVMKTGQVRG